ncbi:MAG: GAF domain-containing sensor histidine kinase [Anaerolineae bacterium]|nr:GAF domain-containing sensor histidine kinase [Anaerolineae bacterium]
MSDSSDREQVSLEQVEHLYQQCQGLQRQVERFQVLQRISQQVAWELDIDRLLHSILRSAVEVMEATAGSLLLLDEMTDELVFAVIEGGGGERLLNTRMSRHQGIAGWVMDHQEAVIVDDTVHDQRFYAAIGKSVDFQTTSLISAPMVARGKEIGVIQILNKQSGERFDQDDKTLLNAFASQSAISIRNAQLYQDLRDERDKLVVVEEDVRKRLARDLHDGPTQLVAAIQMNLQFVRMLLEKEPEKADAEIVQVMQVAEQAMRQLRTMLFDLRPVILETKGLVPALEAYSGRLTETETFTVHLKIEDEIPRLSKQAESAVFAVIQEAIGNAKKHAHASNMWIALQLKDRMLETSVQDDGRGFDTGKALSKSESQGSLGLTNMYERAEMVQGKLSFVSQEGSGATVRLVLPLEPNMPEAQDVTLDEQ